MNHVIDNASDFTFTNIRSFCGMLSDKYKSGEVLIIRRGSIDNV